MLAPAVEPQTHSVQKAAAITVRPEKINPFTALARTLFSFLFLFRTGVRPNVFEFKFVLGAKERGKRKEYDNSKHLLELSLCRMKYSTARLECSILCLFTSR